MTHQALAILLSAALATNSALLTPFAYDPVGNRRTSHLSASHRYEAANRLLEDDDFTYTYSALTAGTQQMTLAAMHLMGCQGQANGNLNAQTRKRDNAQTRYTYSALTGQGGRIACQGQVENQLVSRQHTADSTQIRYRYDGLGRRIEKDVAGTLTRYLYDQEDIWLILNGTTNCATHAVLHGPGIDQPLAFVKDTNADCTFNDAAGFGEPIVYLQADGLGSTTSLVSETSGFFRSLFLAERVTYDSFGQPTILAPDGTPRATSALGNIYFFTGREFDFESGLYYNRHRSWDPHTGRWLQEDPFGGFNDHPLTLNKYPYSLNNPTNFTDPFGLLSGLTKLIAKAKIKGVLQKEFPNLTDTQREKFSEAVASEANKDEVGEIKEAFDRGGEPEVRKKVVDIMNRPEGIKDRLKAKGKKELVDQFEKSCPLP